MAIAASVLVVGLDLTVLNLALPVLSTQLHASTTDLQWFSASYSLVLAAALLPAGLLGDRLGRKKMLLIALVVFGASSAACAFAGSPAELIAARAVLGLGAAVIFPMSIAVLPVLFAPEEQPRAIAVVMGATFIAYPVGPLLGGWLLDNFWWGSVFLINVPVVVLALVAVALLMPESHGARSRPDRHPRDHPVQPGAGRRDLRLHQGGRRAAGATRPRWAPSWPGSRCWPCSWPGSAGPAGTGRPWSSWNCSARPASPGARS